MINRMQRPNTNGGTGRVHADVPERIARLFYAKSPFLDTRSSADLLRMCALLAKTPYLYNVSSNAYLLRTRCKDYPAVKNIFWRQKYPKLHNTLKTFIL